MPERELDYLRALSDACFSAASAARNLPALFRAGRYDSLREKLEALTEAAALATAALNALCAGRHR